MSSGSCYNDKGSSQQLDIVSNSEVDPKRWTFTEDIYRKVFGDDDIKTTATLYELVTVSRAMKEYGVAQQYFQRTLDIRKKVLAICILTR